MQSRRLILILGFVYTLALGVSAQAPADFTGRWIAVEPASVAGKVLVIAHDVSTIKVQPGAMLREASYSLDGKASTATADDGHRVRLSANWRDGKLLLVEAPQDPRLLRHERTLMLDSRGRLVLEQLKPRTAPDQEPVVQSERVLGSNRIVFEKQQG